TRQEAENLCRIGMEKVLERSSLAERQWEKKS
ncbi:unnamed protein product, partial [marine sediment metagenome]